MHYTTDRLLKGDATVVDAFVQAGQLWDKLYSSQPDPDVATLAKFITDQQFAFEQRCGNGDRWAGQEVMVLSGFGRLYDYGDGLDEPRARRLAEAFESSMASLEVKSIARRTAETYRL